MEDRLYKFAHLVEAQSFTKAAALLHISQPALTTAIKKLERELHAELLIRSSHEFTLTDAGKITYDSAKELRAHTDNLKLRLLENAHEKVALNLGMIDSIAALLFVHNNHLHELEKGARLSLTVNNSAQLIRQVSLDELDIALIAEPTHLPKTLKAEPLADEPLMLIASADDTARVTQDLHQKHLSNFLGYNRSSQTYQLVERYFYEHGVSIQPVFYSTSPEIILELVLAGTGTAVLPYLLVKKYLNKGKLKIIRMQNSPGISRRIISIRRAGREIPEPAKRLLESARTDLRQLSVESST